jgi:dephospho-CoA kinase
MKLVIGIAGRRGSGKDTAAGCLCERHGFISIDFSRDILTPVLRAEGRPVTRESLTRLAMAGRAEAGNGVWAERLSAAANGSGAGRIVISGIRFAEEVRVFRKKFGRGFTLTAVICDDKIRFERLKSRGTMGEGGMTYERFLALERAAPEKAVQKTIRMADYILDNSGTRHGLCRQVEAMFKDVCKQPAGQGL